MSRFKVALPTIGRVVHYVVPAGPTMGQHRPAIVIDAHPGGGDWCDLHVFFKPTDEPGLPSMMHFDKGLAVAVPRHLLSTYIQSVPSDGNSHDPQPGSWHWPEKVLE